MLAVGGVPAPILAVCLTVLTYLADRNPAFVIPTLTTFLLALRVHNKRFGCLWSSILLVLPLNLGRLFAISQDIHRVSILETLCTTFTCSITEATGLILANMMLEWVQGEESLSKKKNMSSQLLLPLVWLVLHEILARHHIFGHFQVESSRYPSFLMGTRLEVFCDAIFAQAIADVISLFLSGPGTISRTKTRECAHDIKSICRLAAYVGVGLLALSCAFSLSKRFNPDMLQIGCVRPADQSQPSAVLHELDRQLARGADILMMPASASYISEVPAFIKYKEDIQRRTQNKVTVVVPTMSFKQEIACDMRMKLQIYPLGEAKFLNSYTYEGIRGNNGTMRKNTFGSTFLTWNSRRVPHKHGALSIASAICLDRDFPNIFVGEHSPELVMIPNSAWSKAVQGDKLAGLQSFARRTSTAVLLCDDSEAGYVDPNGRVIMHHGRGNFQIDYNHRTGGRISSWRSLWWIIFPAGIVVHDLVKIKYKSRSSQAIKEENHV